MRPPPRFAGGAAEHVRGVAEYVRGVAEHVRGAAEYVRGAAVHDREAAVHDREAAVHDREAAVHDREAAVHDRGAAVHARGAAVHARGSRRARRNHFRHRVALRTHVTGRESPLLSPSTVTASQSVILTRPTSPSTSGTVARHSPFASVVTSCSDVTGRSHS